MSDTFELAKKFDAVATANRTKELARGELITNTVIDPDGIHVNNPPSDSGFTHGQTVTTEEYVTLASSYIANNKFTG